MAIQGIAIDAVFSGYNGQSAVQFAKFGANGTYSDPQGVPLTSLEGLRVIPSMTGGKSVVREGDIIVSQYMVQDAALTNGLLKPWNVSFTESQFHEIFVVNTDAYLNDKDNSIRTGFATIRRTGVPLQKIYDTTASLLDENYKSLYDGIDLTGPFILDTTSNFKVYISSGSFVVCYELNDGSIIKKVILSSVFEDCYEELTPVSERLAKKKK